VPSMKALFTGEISEVRGSHDGHADIVLNYL
jgi:hypothetical protein